MDRWKTWIQILGLLPFLGMFGTALVSDWTFCYRDASQFYYPLFHWIDAEWRAGRIPLWNPLENTGLPAVADASSSVFYPGKLIFFLPFDFGLRYKLFILCHIVLAQCATYWVARKWGSSVAASMLAGVAYAYGGNVLFQYSNVVFLVGASWIPLAFYAADRMLAERQVWFAVLFGLTLAMTVLGGDPEAGYLAGVAATGYALLLWLRERRGVPINSSSKLQDNRSNAGEGRQTPAIAFHSECILKHRFTLLCISAAVGILLSAVQIVPSLQWASASSRAKGAKPVTVYSAMSSSMSDARDGLFGTPTENTHRRNIYDFSMGPWRLPEFIWPNITGRIFPIHHRWIEIVPGEGRVWSPTNYLGLLPLLCALATFRRSNTNVRDRWLTYLTLGSIVASFGWYGLGFLLDEGQYLFTANPERSSGIGPPVGGLYWFMVTFLPGFSIFRYPAKLLVIAAFGICIFAAQGFDLVLNQKKKWLSRLLMYLGILSAVGLVIVLISWPTWEVWTQKIKQGRIHSSLYFHGVLQPTGATLDIIYAFGQTALLCFVFRWLFTRLDASNLEKYSFALVAITCVELLFANGWLVALGPESILRSNPQIQSLMVADYTSHHERSGGSSVDTSILEGKTPLRIYRSHDILPPSNWSTTSSPSRNIDIYAWEHETLHPRHPLLCSVVSTESFSSLIAQDYETFLTVGRKLGRTESGKENPLTLASMLGATYLLLPPEVDEAFGAPVTIPSNNWLHADIRLTRNDTPLPRAWIVRDVEVLPPLHRPVFVELARRTEHVFFPEGKLRHFKTNAVIETDLPSPLPSPAPPSADLASDSAKEECRVTTSEPLRVEIASRLVSPGLLVLNDFHYPGWRAFIRGADGVRKEVPIFKTNRIMRGVPLPAGEWQVTFEYRPTSFYVGAAVSAVSWLGLTALAFLQRRRGRAGKRTVGKAPANVS